MAKKGPFVMPPDMKPRYVLKTESRAYHSLYTDMAAVAFTPSEMAVLQLKQARIHGVSKHGEVVSVCGQGGKGTMAKLSHDPDRWGMVIYEGTTLPGFSGSAYCCGEKVAGIHTGGGPTNCGFDATFLWVCLKSTMRHFLEDSETWLSGQFHKGNELKYRYSADEVQLFVNDKYHIVQPATMAKVFGENWLVKGHSGTLRKKNVSYEDVDYECVNKYLPGNGPSPGASGSPVGAQGEGLQALEKQVQSIRAALKTLQKTTKSLEGSSKSPLPIMYGPESKTTK